MIVNGYKIEPFADLEGADFEWDNLENFKNSNLSGTILEGLKI